MSHGKTALTLMMALAMPGAVQALGLGEIRLDSALDEPLAADIDLVGATPEDLAGITASIANRDTFERFGVDRSAFLSNVAFKISRDSTGRAVIAIRSSDACTEPFLNLLVDVRWHGGELIRQYTLLLDPPGFPSAAPVAEAALAAPARHAAPAALVAAVPEKAVTTIGEPAARKTIKVGAKATLRGVAWRVGARSDADLNRMMIAIFRANPGAFEGNINRLRRGAVLTIPSATEVESMSVADANHAVYTQMQAWRASVSAAAPAQTVAPAVAGPSVATAVVTPSVATPTVATPTGAAPTAKGLAGQSVAGPSVAEPATAASGAPEPSAPAVALDRRIEQLERGLGELRDQLDLEQDALARAQARLALAEQAPAADTPPQAQPGRGLRASIAAILGLAAAAFGIYAWRRRRGRVSPAPQGVAPTPPVEPADARDTVAPGIPVLAVARAVPVESPGVSREPPPVAARDEAADLQDAIDAEALEVSYILQGSGGGFDDVAKLRDADETASLPLTVKLRVDDPNARTMPLETARLVRPPESITGEPGSAEDATPDTRMGVDTTKLDYDLLDLDATVQHVQMPSALHENVGFKERRTSLVDVLKRAVEREPHRWDLRMKLLQTYYTAAATNRQAFLDVFQKIAEERASLEEGEWDKIAWMGRQIAPDEVLFAAKPPVEEDLVNCA